METALKPAIGRRILSEVEYFLERKLTDYLDDILIAMTDIEEFTHGMSYELFSGDK
jgi:hypothetical protein